MAWGVSDFLKLDLSDAYIVDDPAADLREPETDGELRARLVYVCGIKHPYITQAVGLELDALAATCGLRRRTKKERDLR